MSHASRQIKDWFVEAIESYGNITGIEESQPVQLDANAIAVIRYDREEIEDGDVHSGQLRVVTIEIVLTNYEPVTLDELVVFVEVPLQVYTATAYPGLDRPKLLQRNYSADRTRDRAVYICTLTYECAYYVDRDDPETITN